MGLEKQTVIGKREILEDGHIQVRYDTWILENGVRIGNPSYHREVIAPGDDVSGKDEKIQRIAAVEHTQEVIDKYKNKVKEII